MPRSVVLLLASSLLLSPSVAVSQATSSGADPALFAGLRWRNIGPMRGGRTRSAAGVASQPYTFYIGATNGGVWKTTDAGRTWLPLFDGQPSSSIGAVVVAPSDPNVVYVGSGEGLQRPDLSVGDGIYRSGDAGKTWTHLGLRDAQQIPAIAVDPANPDRLFVAALGHPYGPNEERGIFRSTDGGRTFQRVLYRDENTGGNDVDIDPSDPNVVYANLWEARQGPWENAAWQGTGGLFKSVDGGTTWKPIGRGLPDNVNQANVAISPANPRRLYATIASQGVGIYRSDDAGETWTQITTDARPAGRIGGGDLPVPIPDPKNPDVIIMASTVSWKSVDGGRSWVPFKGAPGGEDYQGGWINPNDPNIVLLVADQGAVVTLNGGETWSSWYNQSTAQLYHVAADDAFPYRLCSGQQESGSACVASRGNYGAISDRDWLPAGGDEYGYLAPDPLDPDIVYGGRSVTRFDRRTGLTSPAGPVPNRGFGAPRQAGEPVYRMVRTQPVVFSRADRHALYFGNNVVWKTTDGGMRWRRISPDLTRTTYELPRSIGKYADPSQATQRGVVYTIAPSPRDTSRIWIGTDDGLIHTTADGGARWRDVTPPQIGPWWKVAMIDAGHFDGATAYAAVNTLRLDDPRPHLYRTHDGGRTWTEIVAGMEGAGVTNAIREDPVRRGLLFASTENGVWVSFDDGDHWQSLRLNLPASSARDIIVKDEDLAVATHGRGFWILDDITRLRQIGASTASTDVVLFRPGTAWRVRWNTSVDMPWPKEEATMPNPPPGVAIDFWLKGDARGPVTLEVLDTNGRVVRRYASADPAAEVPPPERAPVPVYWYKAPQRLPARAGMHRFHWDVHYEPLPAAAGAGGFGRGGLPINSIPHEGVPAPTTPWVNPGTYIVRLSVDGQSHIQPIVVRQDPRVRTPAAAMREVYALTRAMYDTAAEVSQAIARLDSLRTRIAAAKGRATGAAALSLATFEARAAALAGAIEPGHEGGGRIAAPAPGGGRGAGAPAPPAGSLPAAASALAGVLNSLQAADVPATAVQRQAIEAAMRTAREALTKLRQLSAAAPRMP